MTTTLGLLHRFIALVITLLFALTACTSLQGVPMPSEPGKTPAVQVGERVEITNTKGETLRFKVTAIEPDALVGKDVRVPYADIAILQVERNDSAQTGVTVWIVVGVILTGLLIYGLSHLSPGIQE
jgi:hypothetical protein